MIRRHLCIACLAAFAFPAAARAQLTAPPLPGDTQLRRDADQVKQRADAQATNASAEAKGNAAAAQAQGQATAQQSKAAAGGKVEAVKTKAKVTGKSGVQKGTKKGVTPVKHVVGDEAAGKAATLATDKGNTGVDHGVDAAAEKVEGKLK